MHMYILNLNYDYYDYDDDDDDDDYYYYKSTHFSDTLHKHTFGALYKSTMCLLIMLSYRNGR